MKYGLKGICAAFVLVAACTNSHNYPVIGGGGGGGNVGVDGGGHVDGATDGATDAVPGDGGTITGRVCLLTDLRDLTSCASTGASGLTVTLGAGSAIGSATTSDDGSFSLTKPAGTGLMWQVTGSTIVTSSMAYSADTKIPAVSSTDYATLQGDSGVTSTPGQGAVMARITQANSPLAGATASSNPAGQYLVEYAGSNANAWTQNATDAHGTAWLPGLASMQPAVITVAASGGTPSATRSVTPPDQGIAFVMVDLGP